jgi:hypothetical protein
MFHDVYDYVKSASSVGWGGAGWGIIYTQVTLYNIMFISYMSISLHTHSIFFNFICHIIHNNVLIPLCTLCMASQSDDTSSTLELTNVEC